MRRHRGHSRISAAYKVIKKGTEDLLPDARRCPTQQLDLDPESRGSEQHFDGKEFSLYSLRRMVLNRLNSAAITAETRHHSAGHDLSSPTFFVSYLAKCNTLDIQGLVTNGHANQ